MSVVHLEVNSRQRNEFVDITASVVSAVGRAGWRDGVVTVFNPHTTAGLTLNEGADPSVRRDILETLSRLVPLRGDYRHAEGNSDAHVKATLTGSSVAVPLEGGRLLLGTWQAIYFCEYDGPRRRQVLVSFTG
ncbi:MAG: secondary thiamine-phosphate synthase enzyme YjbQ [Acidobacteria bacterium]|nr:secondary thiamine-phosphate synthase enzyme YjbQ [Acidobacteriota bacterium]